MLTCCFTVDDDFQVRKVSSIFGGRYLQEQHAHISKTKSALLFFTSPSLLFSCFVFLLSQITIYNNMVILSLLTVIVVVAY